MQTSAYLKMLFCIVSISFTFYSFSQGTGSSISGSVFGDAQMLEGASVKIKNVSTGFTTASITDKKGYFILRDLPVGIYNIEIIALNFQTQLLTNNALNLGDHLVLGKITLSNSSQTLAEVKVTSNSFANSRDRLGTATAVSERAIRKIPMASRNYTELVNLSPLAFGTSLQGAKSGGTGYLLDGVSNRRTLFGGLTDGAFSISSEDIREFEVETNSYDVMHSQVLHGLTMALTP